MKIFNPIKFILLLLLTLSSCQKMQENTSPTRDAVSNDPLPSWNEGSVKSAIVNYVTRITNAGSPDFIPLNDRIATFDNDGTLWAEKPYMQQLFAFFRVKEMIEKNPALAKKQPFKAVVENDKEYFAKGGMKVLLELVGATHTGMTEDEFEASAKTFFSTAVYPGRNVPIKQMRYHPQLELMDYLRANGFKVFICTGGTIEFVRVVSGDFYGVSPEQVIGTSFKYVYADSSKKVYRLPELDHFNDKEGKPVGIQIHIGKKPVLACGNEGGQGDIAMLSYCQTNSYPTLQLLVNHDDEAREYLYSEADSASLKAAAAGKWQVISMKNDWKEIFSK